MRQLFKIAAEGGFSVVACKAPFSNADLKTFTDRIIQRHEELAQMTAFKIPESAMRIADDVHDTIER